VPAHHGYASWMPVERAPMRDPARFAWALLALLPALLGAAACSPAAGAPEPKQEAKTSGAIWRERVRALREREDALRSSFSPGEQPPWLDVSGADPYRIARAINGSGFVGLLRGSKALVTLDEGLHELDRAHLRETPTALCISSGTGQAYVASRYGSHLVRIGLIPTPAGNVTMDGETELPVAGVADLACGNDGKVYVLPADGSALLTLDASGKVLGRLPALPGALRLQKTAHYLLESSLFERTVRVLELDRRGVPVLEVGRIHHDGTLWAFNAFEEGRSDEPKLVIAVAGVEDKALVRAHGEFENIDSFVWLYRLSPDGVEQLAALDVADYGLVVPKALLFDFVGRDLRLTVLAAGSGTLLQATWPKDLRASPELRTEPAPPGVSDAISTWNDGIVYASPLFDAWIKLDRRGTHFARVDPERRPEPDVRLGEALFFTELMAPDNSSRGTHSRFSCETCHFEGGVDGRTHYTGRDDVSVVTKPLFGLANNRPHFSRAMDPDLSSVCHNEFRVAGAGSGADPWFTLETSRFEWLHELGIDRAELGPLEQRASLLRFLYAFSHAPNARSQGREHFSELEAQGAHAFHEHCEGCHAARLLSDDAASAVAFADWERLILSRNAPLVWARGDYAKTGILPYVHAHGTRITSLRRLALKPRYFTNGSAADLANVLERFREAPEGALHDASGDAGRAPLDTGTRGALLAFLQLL
jgi:hypothetical protein